MPLLCPQLEELPDGDMFVTNSAATNWTVLALKGPVSSVSSSGSSGSRSGRRGTGRHRSHSHSCQGSRGCHQHAQCAGGSGGWQQWWRRWVQQLHPGGLGGHLGGCVHKGPKQQQQQQQQQQTRSLQGGDQEAQQPGGDPPMVQLYKVFSEQPLSEEELGRLFLQHEVVTSHDWKAYPK
jgi:hypothetical protein